MLMLPDLPEHTTPPLCCRRQQRGGCFLMRPSGAYLPEEKPPLWRPGPPGSAPGDDVFMDALRDIRREFPARPTPPATEPWATASPYPARSSPWSGSLPISHKVSANSPKPLHENVQKMPAFCYRYTHYLRKCLCHKNLWVPAALLSAAKITFNVSIKGLSLLPA